MMNFAVLPPGLETLSEDWGVPTAGDFCIKNDELFTTNHEFCSINHEFYSINHDFCGINHEFCSINHAFYKSWIF